VSLSCSVSVAEDLSEVEANRVISALGQHSIAADKAPDPAREGRYRVDIGQADLALAIGALEGAGLPSPASPGVLDSLGESGLVASRKTEQARLVAGTAGELQRSLGEITGVLGARVHLSVTEADPLAPPELRQPPSASVLIRHRTATPPLALADVQRLVAGAVSGLAPERVAVVFQPVSTPPIDTHNALVRFGPLSVTRSSVVALRVLLAGVVASNLLLLTALLFLWTRFRNARRAQRSSEGAT
jgi:type III secretion protein J